MTTITNLDKRFPGWTDGKKYLIVETGYIHAKEFESLPIDAIGNYSDLQAWLRCFPSSRPATIYIAYTKTVVSSWKLMFPHLDIKHARSIMTSYESHTLTPAEVEEAVYEYIVKQIPNTARYDQREVTALAIGTGNRVGKIEVMITIPIEN